MRITIDTATDGAAEAYTAAVALISHFQIQDQIAATVSASAAFAASQDPAVAASQDPATAAFGAAPPEAGVPLVPSTPAPSAAEPAGEAPDSAAPATATETLTTPSGDVDSAGVPWDARIHAGNKATVKDGTWRKKPGVDKETIAAVEAELAEARKGANVAPVSAGNAPPPPPPPAAATPPPPPASAPAAAPPPPPVASADPAPAATPVSSPAPSPVQKFAEALAVFTAAQTAGRITSDKALELARHSVPDAQSLADVLTAATNGSVPEAVDNFRLWLDHTLAEAG